MYIRRAKEADLTNIVDIYNQSIPNRLATADTEPVTVASKLDWYHQRSPNRPLWVATKDSNSQSEILGWLSFQNFYGRPAYLHTAEISLYIATKYHRQGVGSQLLEKAIAFCPQLELTTLLGFIFAHNQPSINLFTRYGFVQWGYLPDIALLDDPDRPHAIAPHRSLIILGKKINSSKYIDKDTNGD